MELQFCVFMVGLAVASGIRSGQGAFQYEYVPEKVQLPQGVDMLNGHGLARDRAGNIYFTYQSTSITPATRALARFNADGTNAVLLGDSNQLAYGTPHGLRIAYEGETGFLYHSNNDATVHKTTLNGSIIWTRNETELWKNTSYWPFAPTDAMVPPPSAPFHDLFVTDGYGQGFVHELDTRTGAYTGFSFGGKGNSSTPPRFNTPHGINYDPRNGLIVLCDRANHRLVHVNHDGTFNFSTPLPQEVTLPCNIDFGFDASHALVPNLGSYENLGRNANGTVAVLDESNNVVSVIEVAKLLGDKGHQHPHDAIFLANGDVVVCCWYPGTISYWRLLSEAEIAAGPSTDHAAHAARHPLV